MNLKFQRLYIENFLSIGNADIDLQNRGYTLVHGVNNNPLDQAKSNGSGKSSIFEALVWCLTGETIRGVKDVVNMYSTEGTCVQVELMVDNDLFVVTRYKDHKKFKTDLKILQNGIDKSGKGIRDSQKLLESYLPDLNASLLGSVIVLGQGLPQRFTNNTPSGRKDVLEKLSKSDFMIEDLKQRLSVRKQELNTKLREWEDTILRSETEIKTYQSQISTAQVKLSSLEDPSLYDTIIKQAENYVKHLTDSIKESSDKLVEYRNEEHEISNQIHEIELEYNRELLVINSERDSRYSDIRSSRASLEAVKRQLEKEIRDAHSIRDTCPTCGRKFDDVFIPDTSSQELQLSNILSELNLFVDQEHIVDSWYTEQCSRLKQQYTTLHLTSKLSEIRTHIKNVDSGISQLVRDRDIQEKTLQNYTQLKLSYTTTVNTLNETIAVSKDNISKLEENLVYYNENKNNIQDRLAAVTKFITLTTRDFRGYLLKNVIQFIDSKAKEYCEDVFDNRSIDFVLDGNNIDIRYCNKQYEACSGGEKQKVDLIVQFAIRDMLCKFLDFSSSIIVLDEIFDNLDTVGCEKIINLISRKLVDIQSIFIITHHSDLQIPEDSTITVTKQNNGVSLVA